MASSPEWQTDGCVWPEAIVSPTMMVEDLVSQSVSTSVTEIFGSMGSEPPNRDQEKVELNNGKRAAHGLEATRPYGNSYFASDCEQPSKDVRYTGKKRDLGRLRTVLQVGESTSSSLQKKSGSRPKKRRDSLRNKDQLTKKLQDGVKVLRGVRTGRCESKWNINENQVHQEGTKLRQPLQSGAASCTTTSGLQRINDYTSRQFCNQWPAARGSLWPNDSSSIPNVAHSHQVGYSAKQRCSQLSDQGSVVEQAHFQEVRGRTMTECSRDVPLVELESVEDVPCRCIVLQASGDDHHFSGSSLERNPLPVNGNNDPVETANENSHSETVVAFDIPSTVQSERLKDNVTYMSRINILKEDLSLQAEECDGGSHEMQMNGLKGDLSAKLGQDNEGNDYEKQPDCSDKDVQAFFECKLAPREEVDFQVDRVLRVMIDVLHPDARCMQGWLGIDCNQFYQICAFYSKVQFDCLSDLVLVKADKDLIHILLEQLVWQYRSLVVPKLAEKALLADDDIDFTKLDLDLYNYDGLDVRKEIAMLSHLAEDLRKTPGVVLKDENEWLLQYHSIKNISDALDTNDRHGLIELGVIDTAKRVSERLLLGMVVSPEEVMELLRDSMKYGFGEYTWLIENHPELISEMEHFELIMENILQMANCVDIRPLRCTLFLLPRFLATLAADDLESCIVKYMGKYESLDHAQSWVELIRHGKKIQDISFALTARFFFCSVNCGAEELLGALLESISLEKKIMAIKSIDCMPRHLRSALIPSCSEFVECGLYSAIRRMVEEMPLARFKADAVFLIQDLCKFCSLSPSLLISEMLFPLMSTSAKGKAAVAISSLLTLEVFRKEIMTGSILSAADLLSVALELYEPPHNDAHTTKYLFIETLLRAINTILQENKNSLKVDLSAVFAENKAIKWYQKVVILKMFFDADVISDETIEYPWQGSANKLDIDLYHEIPMILTSWPGDHSDLLEEFLRDNFEPQDVGLLSRSMLLALDRSNECLNGYLHKLAESIQKLCHDERDWEKYLLEEKYKYQKNSFVQVFDCTGISFGFFADDNQGPERLIINDADLEEAVEFLGNAASLRTISSTSVVGCWSQSIFTAATQGLDDSVFTEGETGLLPFNSLAQSCDEDSRPVPVVSDRADNMLQDTEVDVREYSHSESSANCVDTSNSNECIEAILREICEKLSSQDEASAEPNSTAVFNISSINTQEGKWEEGKGIKKQDIADEAPEATQSSQVSRNSEQGEYANISRSSSATDNACLSSDLDQTSLQQGPTKECILLDLRTFTWALDTVEDWNECPTSIKCKVVLLASKSRCDVIRKRARQLNEADMGW